MKSNALIKTRQLTRERLAPLIKILSGPPDKADDVYEDGIHSKDVMQPDNPEQPDILDQMQPRSELPEPDTAPLSIPDKRGVDTEKLRNKQGIDYLNTIKHEVIDTETGPKDGNTNWYHTLINASSKDTLLKALAERLEEQGYKELGSGSDAYAFDYKGKVLRVCMLYRRKWIESFLDLIKQHPSPHFPTIYENGPFESSYYAIIMERLDKIDSAERRLMDALLSVVLTGSTGRMEPDLVEAVSKLNEEQPKLAEALRLVVEWKNKLHNATLDIQRGRNIMKRGSTYVIVDPFYKKSV